MKQLKRYVIKYKTPSIPWEFEFTCIAFSIQEAEAKFILNMDMGNVEKWRVYRAEDI